MSKKALLECKNVWKKVEHHVIIKDLTFQLFEGDILGFIGANGAGKTTSIKLILGLWQMNGGQVTINGFDLKKNFASAMSQVGAIIENPDLYMYLSGYENLKIVAKIYNISEERIKEVVKLVGLENKIMEKVKKYSLGMRQRLGIAQAILHKPKVLILDEPMNGLDPEGVADLKKLLVDLAQNEQMGIIISSHLLSELESFCTRVCILSGGTILKDETIDNIKKVTNQLTYILEVSSVDLDTILAKYEILDQMHIKIKTEKENLNHIIKALLLNEISIFEVKKEEISLEKVFLNLVNDE